MNKALLFVASLLASASAFAQWTKPATPAAQPLSVGSECYLYNLEAGGYLLGANDWGTRASISSTLGHKVYIENGLENGSYYLTNYVLQGGMADQIGYMFLDELNAIYVDNTKDGKENNQYTFEAQTDGSYLIGLSPANAKFNPATYMGAYLGINTTKVGDTRLYFCDPENSENYTMDQCQLKWIFVSPADYAAHVAATLQYEAAVALGNSIEDAKAAGVDATAAEAVYNNTSSTTDDLTAAKTTLDDAVQNAGFNNATIENPYTVKLWDFENKDASAWSTTVAAQNKGADNGNNAADYAVTGIHYENWNGSNFTLGGTISTVTDGLPAGVYQLEALAFTNSGKGVKLFAGKSNIDVTTTNIDATKPVEVLTFIQNEGKLEYGLQVEANVCNWVGLDNVKLQYLGSSAEAYNLVVERIVKNAPVYTDETTCEKTLLQPYYDAKQKMENATDPAVLGEAIDEFDVTLANLAKSVAAYENYVNLIDEAQSWLNDCGTENDFINALSDYLSSDEETGYNGNGSATYIVENGTLNTTQIESEIKYLDKLYNDARANALGDGSDCTDLLKNPDFAQTGGWNAAAGIEWPLPADKPDAFHVFQAWGRVADVHQNLTGLQNGIYEMNLQAAYKPDGDIETRQTYAYINDFETLIPLAPETDGVYTETSEQASELFAAGGSPVKVYGLVTDGTMKIGIANRLRTGENGILWAGGVSLVFRDKNEEATENMIGVLKTQSESLKDNYCGTAETEALAEAVATAEDYESLIALKAAIDNVKASTSAYASLSVAISGLEDAIEKATTADAFTLAKANELLETAKVAYDNKSYDNAAATAAVEELNAMTVAVKIGKINATEDNPMNMSSAIVNNTFDPAKGNKDEKRIDGWVVSGALNGYKQNTCSFNKGTFDLHQDLSGLPKGNYEVTVHTYYRAGSYEEEAANINAGKDTHLMKLYANDQETSVMNLSEGSKDVTLPDGIGTREINGIIVPDGTGASATCYAAGLFLNKLRFTVGEDGKAVIGLKLPETIGTNDYTVVGEWNLWYMGNDTPAVTEEDMTSLIVNNTFDPAKGSKDEKRIDGWVVSGALNGYKSNTCSFNKGTFDLHQDLSGLPAGKYKVTVHTYYRAGSYEEEAANINADKDTHLMLLYANNPRDQYMTSVMNLSEGSKDVTLPEGIGTREINGITVPDGTGASAACFAAGLFLNELEFMVGEDGKATIGLMLPETIGTNDYTVVGEWNLYYYGMPKPEYEDMTSLIVNNTFDPSKGNKDEKRIDGWVVEGALNGYKQNTCSFNKGTFDLHQDLVGLPKGKYKATVHTYYRAGSYEEEAANILADKDTHLMKLYANTADEAKEVSVMNLSEGSRGATLPEGIGTREINGIIVPDGTGASAACYAAGLFLNEIEFTVGDDGKATIGLRLPETIGTNDYTVVGEWNLYYYGLPQDLEEQDMTSLIVNNIFDPAEGNKDEKRINGWSVEGALNGYKSYSCSFNKGTFDLHQDLVGLPEGTYKVTVNTFYRAGSYEEEAANINAGKDTHLMKFYANTSEQNYETSVMNLSEGSKGVTLPEGIGTREINGITVPDGTGASVACYEAGLFLNELVFYVGKDGKATIGLKLEQTIGTNDYTVVGPWHLYYYGNGNHIDDVPTDIECIDAPSSVEAIPVAIFSINGAQIAAPMKGINLIKMSDGTVRKIMVK